MKIKPLLPHLDCKLLFTGQHTELLSDIVFDYKIKIEEEGNRLDQVISSCLSQFPDDVEIDSVLVQGDTASAFACALAAFNRKIKVIHLEAGLRTYDLDNPYPEEGYRQMISRITNIHLCPTELSKSRVLNECVGGVIEVVGNTVLDNIVEHKDDVTYENIVLVTLHRRENHAKINEWFSEINKLAVENTNYRFILPIHPNPNVIKHRNLLSNVEVIDPLNHEDLISVLKTCALTITDSGGIQEEATFLNKKSIVCRSTTERPEAIEHLLLCSEPNKLKDLFKTVIDSPIINSECPYGDGRAAEKIKKVLYES